MIRRPVQPTNDEKLLSAFVTLMILLPFWGAGLILYNQEQLYICPETFHIIQENDTRYCVLRDEYNLFLNRSSTPYTREDHPNSKTGKFLIQLSAFMFIGVIILLLKHPERIVSRK